MELWGLECGSTFSIQTSLLNISHLLHKMGFVPTEVGTTVCSPHCSGGLWILGSRGGSTDNNYRQKDSELDWRKTLHFFLISENFNCSTTRKRGICTTVVLKRESKWHDLWSKLPTSDLVFYNIKMPPCSGPLSSTLQLTGALKLGTVYTSTSTGTGIMKSQSKNFEICLIENKCSTLTFHNSCAS